MKVRDAAVSKTGLNSKHITLRTRVKMNKTVSC